MQPHAKWTVMVYLAGDNNLSAAGATDLAEMRTIGSTDDVNIVVEFDNAGDHGTKRYRLQHGGVDDLVEFAWRDRLEKPNGLARFSPAGRSPTTLLIATH